MLKKTLNAVTHESTQTFSLSFGTISFISLQNFLNFSLIYHEHIVKGNISLLCCISNTIFSAFISNSQISSFEVSLETVDEDETLNCISSFINYLNEKPFSFENFSLTCLLHVVNVLEIKFFENALSKFYQILTTLQ